MLRYLIALTIASLVGGNAVAQEHDPLADYHSAAPVDEEFRAGLVTFLQAGLSPRLRATGIDETKRLVPSKWHSEASFLYAVAMVQLSKRSDDAMDTLRRARGTQADPYYPAWKGLIVQTLRGRGYADAFQLMEEFAELQVRRSGESSRVEECQLQLTWLGKVAGGLTLALTKRVNIEPLERTTEKIREILPNDLQAAFDSGIASVREQHDAIIGSIDDSRQTDSVVAAKENEGKQRELVSQQADLLKQQGNLELTAEEYEKKMEEYSKEFEKKIGVLQKQFNTLNNQLVAQATAITTLESELRQLEFRKSNFRDDKGRQITVSADPDFVRLLRSINLVQQRLSQARTQYNRTYASTQGVYNAGMREIARQQAIVAEYKQRTGKIFKEGKAISYDFKKIEKKKEEIRDRDTKDSSETLGLRKQAKSLNTYAPFDVTEECKRLIHAFGPTPSEADSSPDR